jgi:hypothetical protein
MNVDALDAAHATADDLMRVAAVAAAREAFTVGNWSARR